MMRASKASYQHFMNRLVGLPGALLYPLKRRAQILLDFRKCGWSYSVHKGGIHFGYLFMSCIFVCAETGTEIVQPSSLNILVCDIAEHSDTGHTGIHKVSNVVITFRDGTFYLRDVGAETPEAISFSTSNIQPVNQETAYKDSRHSINNFKDFIKAYAIHFFSGPFWVLLGVVIGAVGVHSIFA